MLSNKSLSCLKWLLFVCGCVVFFSQILIIAPNERDTIIIEPFQKCMKNEDGVLLLIGVMSSPESFDRRAFIRATWANMVYYENMAVKVVFVMGKKIGGGSEQIQHEIEKENAIYNDIVQDNFIDSYRNLTLKTISLLKWITLHCPSVRFVLKIDDDLIVHPFKLTQLISEIETNKTEGTFICWVRLNTKPIRDETKKWFVSESEYSKPMYPSYCGGAAYIITGDLISQLYKATFDVPIFWWEDVYITGLLAEKVGANLENLEYRELWFLNYYYSTRFKYHRRQFVDGSIIFFHTGYPGIRDTQKRDIWYSIL